MITPEHSFEQEEVAGCGPTCGEVAILICQYFLDFKEHIFINQWLLDDFYSDNFILGSCNFPAVTLTAIFFHLTLRGPFLPVVPPTNV